MKKNPFFNAKPAALLLFLLAFTACSAGQQAAPTEPQSGKIRIVASFYPIAEFARRAGGDAVDVYTVIPSGTEPHDFEPTPQDLAKIGDAQLFVYNGNGLDPWADKVGGREPGVAVINMAATLEIPNADPHFWLDPEIAKKETEAIRDALIRIDPARRGRYADNTAAFAAKLDALDQKFASALASCRSREIFTSHDAFSWLARRYGLVQTSIAGLNPEAEPSARQLAELADQVKAGGIRYIFFETLASPKIAQTLAEAAGAQTLVLNPLEGLTASEVESGKDYISVMEENLTNLSLALNCQ